MHKSYNVVITDDTGEEHGFQVEVNLDEAIATACHYEAASRGLRMAQVEHWEEVEA